MTQSTVNTNTHTATSTSSKGQTTTFEDAFANFDFASLTDTSSSASTSATSVNSSNVAISIVDNGTETLDTCDVIAKETSIQDALNDFIASGTPDVSSASFASASSSVSVTGTDGETVTVTDSHTDHSNCDRAAYASASISTEAANLALTTTHVDVI